MIDEENWPIAFNTILEEKQFLNSRNITTLMIQNKKDLLEVIIKYIQLELNQNRPHMPYTFDKERNHIKQLIAYLFVNATTEDFLNPIQLVERNINFLKDQTFQNLQNGKSITLGEAFLGSKLEIKNTYQNISMETPQKLEFKLTKEEEGTTLSFQLPEISYGITQNDVGDLICYIYSILNPKETIPKSIAENTYRKKINRLLYKLNNHVLDAESEEYKEFKKGDSTYYPENISDVSPSAVLSLLVFIHLLEQKKINKICVVPYLPLRYLSREQTAEEKEGQQKEQLLERNHRITENTTNKFLRTFFRAQYHMKNLKITALPYEQSEFLELKIANVLEEYNSILLEEVMQHLNK